MKNKKIDLFFAGGLLCVFLFTGCFLNPDFVFRNDVSLRKENEKKLPVKKKWTILIYMAADNNLESDAIDDICEMERSSLNCDEVNVLMLFDRSPLYDTSNDNWTDTRLYRLKTFKEKENQCVIGSERLKFDELQLGDGFCTELDMSSEFVLTKSIDFAKKEFPSDYFGLIMWGHGSGWRGNDDFSGGELKKGFAFDDTSEVYMSLVDMRHGLENGLNGEKLDFLGFDTCFGAEMEVLYELRNCAEYAVGSEGLILSSGWDYESLFNDFEAKEDKSPLELCKSVVSQFKKTYLYKNQASVTAIDLSKMDKLFNCFEDFMFNASELISDAKCRDEIINGIYSECEIFTYGTLGSDVYVDVNSLMDVICKIAEKKIETLEGNGTDGSSRVFEVRKEFGNTMDELVIDGWSAEKTEYGLGLYFATLAEGGLFASTHPSGYISGKTVNQVDFVKSSEWYVPYKQTGKSFLDKLFYVKKWI